MKELKEKAKEFLKNSGNNNDYTSLKNLIKGFNKTDIEGIPDEAFKYVKYIFESFYSEMTETATQRCSQEKVFRKYAANLQ